MAGLFALIYFALRGHAGIKDGFEKAKYTDYSKNKAIEDGDIYYDDGWGQTRSTQTNEPVKVLHNDEVSAVIGKSGKVYQARLSEEKLEEVRLRNAIEYCKENGIKYLPFHFNTDYPFEPGYTGIEIETGRKYGITRYGDYYFGYNYYLIYLQDKPHKFWHERRGMINKYLPVHDGTEEMERYYHKHYLEPNFNKEEHPNVTMCRADNRGHYYYTIMHPISEEEGKLRLSEVEKYPAYKSYNNV